MVGKRNYGRSDMEITDRIIRVNMKYYIVYSIRIIIYFVDDMIYVLSIFSFFLSKQIFLAAVASESEYNDDNITVGKKQHTYLNKSIGFILYLH